MFCNSQIENFTLNLHLQKLPPFSQVYPSKRPCLPPPGPSESGHPTPDPPRQAKEPSWLAQFPPLPMDHTAPHLMWPTCVHRKSPGDTFASPVRKPFSSSASHILLKLECIAQIAQIQLALCNSEHSVCKKSSPLTRTGSRLPARVVSRPQSRQD